MPDELTDREMDLALLGESLVKVLERIADSLEQGVEAREERAERPPTPGFDQLTRVALETNPRVFTEGDVRETFRQGENRGRSEILDNLSRLGPNCFGPAAWARFLELIERDAHARVADPTYMMSMQYLTPTGFGDPRAQIRLTNIEVPPVDPPPIPDSAFQPTPVLTDPNTWVVGTTPAEALVPPRRGREHRR